MTEDARRADLRPSPDALLEEARRELRGRLRIFLGAAPGVGKTYAMLEDGRARRAEGIDVVIGVVETHGRRETAALLAGFEIIPPVWQSYRGHRFAEMDLDAILARRPALVLVDELAHSNAPGSRHPKRYLDVEEILANGIDVHTTVNIQHVESLNDVVAQITRITVRETVPDSIIDRADDIEIVDLTPEDLIKRLHEGKVYLPATAQQAIRNYFSPGNLTALRELALRRTAQRVDDQLLTHMRANAIAGPWAAGEKVLVCVTAGPGAQALIRQARRHAGLLHAEWTALHVETPRAADLSGERKDMLNAALRLAQRLGGEAVTRPGQDVAREILDYATTHNFTQVIIGPPTRPSWRAFLQGSVSNELIRRAGDLSIHVVPAHDKEAPRRGPASRAAPARFRPGDFLLGLVYTACAVPLGMVLDRFLQVQNISLVFLLAILVSSVTAGLWPALFTSLASALAFNFFFLPPTWSFTIGDPESVVALIVFLIVGVTASNLTARLWRQAAAASARARVTEDLNRFSRKLAGTGKLDDVLWATAYQMASMLELRVVLLLPEEGALTMMAGYPPDDMLADADLAAAHWAWDHDRPAGRGSDTLPGARRLYLPLRTGRGPVGIVGLDDDRSGPLLSPDQRRLFDALADQAAVAIERVQLVAAADRAGRLSEADRLRGALLSSISHDLRTPLAAILGAAGAIRDYPESLSEADRAELLATVIDESERLNRFIANLLDMTRLESGAIRPNFALVDLADMVGAAARRAEKILRHHELRIELASDLPMARVDPVLFEQVLFNLLDNAAKYAPEGTVILLGAMLDEDRLVTQVLDEGPGIPPADLERVFDSFHRVGQGDRTRAGTGLGLSIARGFVEAMGGTITAGNRSDRSGAVFTIRLPTRGEERG